MQPCSLERTSALLELTALLLQHSSVDKAQVAAPSSWSTVSAGLEHVLAMKSLLAVCDLHYVIC